MKITGLIGIALLLGIAYALSNNRKAISTRTVVWGISLQIFFAIIILKIPFVKAQFSFVDTLFKKLISFSDALCISSFAGHYLLFKSHSRHISLWNHTIHSKTSRFSNEKKYEN